MHFPSTQHSTKQQNKRQHVGPASLQIRATHKSRVSTTEHVTDSSKCASRASGDILASCSSCCIKGFWNTSMRKHDIDVTVGVTRRQARNAYFSDSFRQKWINFWRGNWINDRDPITPFSFIEVLLDFVTRIIEACPQWAPGCHSLCEVSFGLEQEQEHSITATFPPLATS